MRPTPAIVSLLSLATITLGGCAGYRLTPLERSVDTGGAAGSVHTPGTEGYVFYAPSPYLLGTLQGTKDGNPGYDYKIIFLPDYDRPYRFTRFNTLAQSDLKISFAEGWMFTGAESSVDTTALLGLATALVEKLPFAPTASSPAVVLYRLEWDEKGFHLTP